MGYVKYARTLTPVSPNGRAAASKPADRGSIPRTGASLKRESDGLGGRLQPGITGFNSLALLQ